MEQSFHDLMEKSNSNPMDKLKVILNNSKIRTALWLVAETMIGLVIVIGTELQISWLIPILPALVMLGKWINKTYLPEVKF